MDWIIGLTWSWQFLLNTWIFICKSRIGGMTAPFAPTWWRLRQQSLMAVWFITFCCNWKPVDNYWVRMHPQHETSRDSEIQTKEDFKSKSRKRLRSLSTVSWNSNDWYEYWNTKKSHHRMNWIPRELSWNKVTTKNIQFTRTLQCVFI